jgi:hypothetical protein
VLLGVLSRLRSTDSVARELLELRTRNEQAHSRRRARDRLAAAMTTVADPLAAEAWQGYREVRTEHAARTIGVLIAAGQRNASGRWSERELVTAIRGRVLRFIPSGELVDAVQRTGVDWTGVRRLRNGSAT